MHTNVYLKSLNYAGIMNKWRVWRYSLYRG